MKKFIKFYYIALVVICFIFNNCESVDIDNFNDPDLASTLDDANSYPSILSGAYSEWWSAIHEYSPYMTLSVAADHGSSSWGNFNMQNVGTVTAPYGEGDHASLNNTQTAPNTTYLNDPWYRLYGAIGTANDILRGINQNDKVVMNGDVDITEQTVAHALFVRGLSYGYLGLLFDRSFIVTDETDLNQVVFNEEFLSSYEDVVAQSLNDIDLAISKATAFSNFELTQFNGLNLNQSSAIKLMNSYAAKILALKSRVQTENESNDWSRIASYANNGIDNNFAPLGDGGNIWSHAYFLQGNHIWMRVDQQIINMIDNRHPYPFPQSGYTIPTSPSPDARLGDTNGYFVFQGAPIFRPERGEYFFSYYRFDKYQSYRSNLSGPMTALTAADNDLLYAEALIRSGGSTATAVDLINRTKVNIGQLPPATAADNDLLDQIQYERFLEAYESPGNPFFDRRRNGTLGNKQFTQFPIPALELNTIDIPLYTFGGE